ncbi:MAG: UDP-N-acetylmuramoyl-L-alanyl-D-glutamate--2,6-diaminopimelate ligase [Candidatus Melainabacteria bacterium]|nr:UDP-N-acetylmuramoyl-L-alanyl-D-glutamate--2,6-diaminopimelate ligase [Candidatus Melainabacteria bacterium]
MRLSHLLASTGFNSQSDPDICDVTTDPNLCSNGVLYLACESETIDSSRFGVRLDGRKLIDTAIKNGASAILSDCSILQQNEVKEATIPIVIQENPLSLLGLICSKLFDQKRPENLALVTGTNGKTSTVNFAKQIWSGLGNESCSVGNLGGVCSDGTLVWERDPVLSVPETVFMHKMLTRLAKKGIDYVAMEATSHALFDYRLHHSNANIGAFCNLTRDHLDFHLNMQEYFRVKMLLFTSVLPVGSAAVLNADSDYFEPANEICKSFKHQIITYGRKGKQIRLIDAEKSDSGQKLHLQVFGKTYEVAFNLYGEFQVSNALCALSIAIASGMDKEHAVLELSRLCEVEGRLNHVATLPSGGKIIVDFAHTPDGLRAALEACRSFTSGQLIVIFGSAGNRDQGKRPLMGEIATRLADLAIVTNDSPNSEDPATIRKEILTGALANAIEIDERLEAIKFAAARLQNNDTLLLAGLGHETSINVGDKTLPFSDIDIAKSLSLELHN